MKGSEHLLGTFQFIFLLIFLYSLQSCSPCPWAVNGDIRNGGWISEIPKPNIFLPQPWAAGSPWTLISSHRGREAGVTAFSLPTSCLPPFLSNHWHKNLTCSVGWGVMAMARQVLSNLVETNGWGLRYWAHGLCISHTHTYIHTRAHRPGITTQGSGPQEWTVYQGPRAHALVDILLLCF